MKHKTLILLLLAVLLLCLLPALVLSLPKEAETLPGAAWEEEAAPPSGIPEAPSETSSLAEMIQPDSSGLPDIVVPTASPAAPAKEVTVSAGSTVYAYEGMLVTNNGGTVYSTGATVYNNAGTVFCNGGIVYNDGGKVYAKTGTVFNSAGTVYKNDADVVVLGDELAGQGQILGYYELKLADYYEPYVVLEGVVNEPGSEMMIISEDSVCHVTPKEGWRIISAESEIGELVFGEDGSVDLVNVTGDTTLKLEIEAK